MKIIGIIQCRTGSRRLPQKALLPLAGKPMIWRYIERVKRCKMLDEIVLATTWKDEDKVLCDIAEELGIKFFLGSENDLVDRIYKCAVKYKADVIVRLTADNPLIEPEEIDRIIEASQTLIGEVFSNTCNIRNNDYPDGLGAEVYTIKEFGDLWSKKDYSIEHPHTYFDFESIPCPIKIRGYSDKKLTVDTQKDYEFISNIYNKYGAEPHFTDYKEML